MKIHWKNKYLLGTLAVILIALIMIRRSGDSGGNNSEATSRVLRQTITQRVTIAGTVQPFRKSFITAAYKGYVRKLFVHLGEQVKMGDAIASVGTSLTTNEQVFPLRSPITGQIVQLPKSEGEFVKEADPSDFIARIDDLSKLLVNANVPEMERVKIKIGQDAVVKASAILDRTYKAIVREATLAANENDRWQRSTVVEYPVRLELIDFDEKLKPGMSVLIDIVANKKDAVLTLRHEYIAQEKDRYFVTLASGERRSIHLGLQNDEMSEILDGINEGDEIVKVDFSKMSGTH